MPRRDIPDLSRSIGPVTISVFSAPESVLRAVAEHAIGGADADGYVRELLKRRSDESFAQNSFAEVAINAKLSNEQRLAMNRLLTLNPTLWWIEVELHSPRTAREPSRISARYGGYLTIARGSRSRSEYAQQWQRSAPFLSWEKLKPVDRRGR